MEIGLAAGDIGHLYRREGEWMPTEGRAWRGVRLEDHMVACHELGYSRGGFDLILSSFVEGALGLRSFSTSQA